MSAHKSKRVSSEYVVTQCTHCGFAQNASNTRCKHCGVSMDNAKMRVAECSKCGYKQDAAYRFCMHCGEPMHATMPDASQPVVTAAEAYIRSHTPRGPLMPSGAFRRFNALADVERALPAPVAQHSGAIALGLGGLALLGVAGYFAFRNKAPPAAGSAPNVLKAPAPAPSKSPPAKPAPAASPAPRAPMMSPAFSVGQHVDAAWTDGNYYPGRVSAVDGTGRYQIAWDDGGAPTWATASQVRASAAPAAPPAPATGTMGAVVKAAGPLADCISRGGNQVDENGNCFKGDERIP